MALKNVCVSFDYEHDKEYYYLLEAWNKNPKIPFWITNCTPSEIQTDSVSKDQYLQKELYRAEYPKG